MLAGSVDLYDPLVRTYVEWTGVPFLAVDYRLAPEYSAGTLATDALLGLQWLLERSLEFGVDPARIAVMGDSAGGGVAAALAVLARDTGIRLAKQVLLYPMLDDRNTVPDPQLSASPTIFSYAFNRTAWSAVLGDAIGTDTVPPAAAPARNTDFTDLAPAYVEVGEMDIFRDEDVAVGQHQCLARALEVGCDRRDRVAFWNQRPPIAPAGRVGDGHARQQAAAGLGQVRVRPILGDLGVAATAGEQGRGGQQGKEGQAAHRAAPERRVEKPSQTAASARTKVISDRISPAGIVAQASLAWISAAMKPMTKVAISTIR